MIAMQYAFPLAETYDMGAIRARIAEKGPQFDQLPGLVNKAFLVNDRGTGSPFNEYATFYVWKDEAAMRDFLLSERFQAVVDTFGRPRVRHWTLLEQRGASDLRRAGFAQREFVPLADPLSVTDLLAQEREATKRLTGSPGFIARVTALDAELWEAVRFTLWRDRRAAPHSVGAHAYDVAYIACPECLGKAA
jgi:hypothetical protein